MDKDCYALKSRNRCKILTAEKCIGSTCPFYKSQQQAVESCEKANARLQSLDKDRQKHIADKYYGGRMVWLKGGASNGR